MFRYRHQRPTLVDDGEGEAVSLCAATGCSTCRAGDADEVPPRAGPPAAAAHSAALPRPARARYPLPAP
ncbi:MAG: hypothetical protein FJ265_09405 [Planctomycetes bacterium]|nr:hypothetical protein [Planctomycetota bacterium]